MISRHWTGLVKKGREDEYIAHLKNETFNTLNQIKGFVNASILKRELIEGTEYIIITIFIFISFVTSIIKSMFKYFFFFFLITDI